MCNCHKEVAKKVEEITGADPGTVENYSQEVMSGRTFSDYVYKKPGEKKQRHCPVLHSYCSHCGEPYEKK